jgi:hypothetical protein
VACGGINGLRNGYRGLCSIDGLFTRVSSFDVNVKQGVEFYDHTFGLSDNFTAATPSSPSGAKGELLPSINVQKYFWRPGVKMTSGGISLFPSVAVLSKLFDLAKYGKKFDITVWYTHSVGRRIKNCKLNSFQFNIQSGNVLDLNLDIMAEESKEFFGDPPHYTVVEKLIPWAAIEIKTKHINLPIASFNFNVENSCIPIYTAGSLDPKKIRNGMQNLTGSVSYYWNGKNPSLSPTILDEKTGPSEISIKIGDGKCGGSFSATLCVVYTPILMKSSTEVVSQLLSFNGVGYALGV